jgi:hypothetical protein
MLDVFNFPTPQTANYQEFYGGEQGFSVNKATRTWVKPRGASMIRIMLIGAGGGGGNGSSTAGGGGGGSGAVTSWIGPAIFIPDILYVGCGTGGIAANQGGFTNIVYKAKNDENLLLESTGGNGASGSTQGAGGTAMTANYFTASGIFTSIAGQAGAGGSATGAGGNVSASSTTFLSGGAGGAGSNTNVGGRVTPNYGYLRLENTPAGGATAAGNGYFITQPILVGCGGAGGTTSTSVGTAGGRGGIGCGGGGGGEDANPGGAQGGDGAVFIWSW